MNVKLSTRARRRIETVANWHRANHSPIFDEELAQAMALLGDAPHIGSLFVARKNIRRWLLPKSQQFVYYSVNEAAQLITIVTVWGTKRGTLPKL